MTTLDANSQTLSRFLADHPRLTVLTGAGISAASGIPTYRDHTGNWQSRTPIQHQDFIKEGSTRQRYWARSWYGWPLIRDAQPNAAHFALLALERAGQIESLITQNVDGLHARAGSQLAIDLHGRVDRVRCLDCAVFFHRQDVQEQLAADNEWPAITSDSPRPDGDWDIPDYIIKAVHPPQCQKCGGTLMPDVVFFGGSVARSKVAKCLDAVAASNALLVVGSSLTVYSGFRFCRHANKLGVPIGIINTGPTRADELALMSITDDAAAVLQSAIQPLTASTDKSADK
ncbi:NAD-dependent protein deacetylase [bacterium]|jgi:NAD-dependent SIR2 family protein deacetylase|nr:NAD-dependent protein deacetylase [bacterium]